MNLLVTGAWKYTQAQLGELRAKGHCIFEMPDERGALPCAYEQVEGVIGNGLFLYHPIERFTALRYIQLTSAGFDRVPMDYVSAHGIRIYNARGVYSVPMAEFVLSSVLQLYKQSAFFRDNQRDRRWEKHRGLVELCGKTVGIVGCGSVGTECAKRFRAFGCTTYGVDIAPYEQEDYVAIYPLARLDEVLRQADVVVLTLPLTEETVHLMNAKRLSQMKEGAILVNIARGAVVDTDALLRAMDRLGGAVIDVFEQEPLPQDSPLWESDRILLTPHNSFVGDGNADRLWSVIERNLRSEADKV